VAPATAVQARLTCTLVAVATRPEGAPTVGAVAGGVPLELVVVPPEVEVPDVVVPDVVVVVPEVVVVLPEVALPEVVVVLPEVVADTLEFAPLVEVEALEPSPHPPSARTLAASKHSGRLIVRQNVMVSPASLSLVDR
jgi:hypothetical protein